MTRRYVLSLIDQLLLSAFNFALSLILIRTWEPKDYGTYIFWTAIALFFVGIQNALVNTPLSVFAPAAKTKMQQIQAERVISSVNFIFIVIAFAISFVLVTAFNYVFPLPEAMPAGSALVIAMFVAGMLLREYARGVGFSRQHIVTVMRTDCTHLIIACGALVVYWVNPEQFDLMLVLGFLALGSAAGGTVGLLMVPERRSVLSFRHFSRRAYSTIWKQSKWALTGVIAGELQQRAYIYLVTGMAGSGALGVLAAAGILFRPIPLVLAAWGLVVRPRLAEAAINKRTSEIVRALQISTVVFVACLVLFYVFIYIAWTPIQTFLYGKKYGDVGWIAAGWGVIGVVLGFRSIGSIALQSLKKFRPLAFTTLLGGIVSLLSLIIIIPVFGYKWSILGLLFGNLLSCLYTLTILSREIKSLDRPEKETIL